MTRNTILYLRDIHDNMRLTEEFFRSVTPEEFSLDRKTAYAVLRRLGVIGEVANRVLRELGFHAVKRAGLASLGAA